MDLDELKNKWAEHDQKLEANIRLNRKLLTATSMNQARSVLRRLALSLALESAVTFVVILALGDFIYEHIAMAGVALAGVVLDLFALAILIALIRQIQAALQIDYGQPIGTIQKELGELRILRIRYIQGVFLTATLAWTPLLIVALQGVFGLDAYSLLGAPYLFANVLVGLAIIPLGIWLSKKYGDRMGRSPIIQRFMNDLAGHNLNEASRFLATLSEFEDEKGADSIAPGPE